MKNCLTTYNKMLPLYSVYYAHTHTHMQCHVTLRFRKEIHKNRTKNKKKKRMKDTHTLNSLFFQMVWNEKFDFFSDK